MDEWGGLLTKMFCFPSVGTISWYIVPQKCSHTSIASDSAFTILYKSVTCNGCNDRGPWVTQLFQTRTTDSISVLCQGVSKTGSVRDIQVPVELRCIYEGSLKGNGSLLNA